MEQIEKSSIVVEKEQYLKELVAKKKKILTQLKRNKTILEKLKAGITEMQQKAANSLPDILQQFSSLQSELLELLKKVKKSRKIPREDKVGLEDVIATFEAQAEELGEFGIPEEDLEEMQQKAHFNTDEFDRQRAFNFFDQFVAETKADEQKSIRKIFIRLANRFHPDKAKSKKEAEKFHKLMQTINDAYQRGDLATLLDIQSKYENKQTLLEQDLGDEVAIVDFLEGEIDKTEREVNLLKEQLGRLKKEIKNIRASDVGEAYKEEKRAVKYGYGGVEIQIENMQSELDQLKALRDGLKTYLETGIMPEVVEAAFMAPTIDPFFMEEEIEMDDLLSIFDEALKDMFEEEFEEKPKKKKRGKRRR